MFIQQVLNNINNNKNLEFNIYEEVLTPCGYKGLCIVSKKPNIENAYQIAADLILNELVYEVAVLDFLRCSVYTYYRDYGEYLGKQIKFAKDDFDRYASKNSSDIGEGVHIRITTLAIKEADLIKISDKTEIKEVINYIQGLYPFTKPKPIIKGEPTEYELIEMINYIDRDFKVEECNNWDCFRDGYFVEGKLIGNVPTRIDSLIKESNRLIDSALFVKTKENKGFITYKDDNKVADFPIQESGYINQPKLNVDDSYVVIKVYLELTDLQVINNMENFEEVFEYLRKESRKNIKPYLRSNEQNDLELPF